MKSITGMKWHDWLLIGVLGLGAVLAPLYIAFGWQALFKFLTHPATTAWVEALGSIGAILGAVWVARYQTAKQLEAEQRRNRDENLAEQRRAIAEQRRKIAGYLALMKYSREIFEKISEATLEGARVLYPAAAMMRVEIGGVTNQLRRLDLREVADSEKLTDAVSVSVAAAELLLSEMDGYIVALHKGSADLPSLHTTASIMRIQLGRCEATIAEAIEDMDRESIP